MIVVRNTVELENMFDIDSLRDDEQIMIWGGMSGKEKYNYQKYHDRVTYTGRQVKQIINEMRKIELEIPKSWNQWQRAKYIYETLANRIQYVKKDSLSDSNLTGLITNESVCARIFFNL